MGPVVDLYELYGAINGVFLEENFLAYRLGGFHPVTLGDTLKDGRYEIQHKLGCGGFSTVWLARDYEHKQWVSIKITRPDLTDQSRELHNLRELAQARKSCRNPGPERIVRLLDEFGHTGPNGHHQCLVFELLGPTVGMEVRRAHDFEERLDTDDIIKVSTQVLEAIAFMHEAGYAHGDLSLQNIAFYNRRLPYVSKEELFDALRPPSPKQLKRLDSKPLEHGVPSQLVASTRWNGWPLDDDEYDDIRIIDLGSAFHQDTPPKGLDQARDLRAPEMFFTGKFDHRQDLWSVGLMVYQLVFGSSPYCSWEEYYAVRGIIDVFGDLPPKWEPKWQLIIADAVAKDSRMVAGWVPSTKYRVEKQFEEKVHEPALKALLPVIQGLTKLLPEDRMSASQALQLVRQIVVPEDSEGSVEEESDSGGAACAGGVEGGQKEAQVSPK